MDWVLDRIREPSTWAAIAAGLTALGVGVDAQTVGAVCGGLAALVGIILKERGR